MRAVPCLATQERRKKKGTKEQKKERQILGLKNS